MKLKYTWWQDDNYFLGYLNDYPNYPTQGTSKEDLQQHLKALWEDINSQQIPYIKTEEELMVA